jgi:hypothetical protein
MIGLIFDRLRVISAGTLRGWDTLLFPTIMSGVTMLITIGIGISFTNIGVDGSELRLILRDVAVFISAAALASTLEHSIAIDRNAIQQAQPQLSGQWPNFFKTALCCSRPILADDGIDMDSSENEASNRSYSLNLGDEAQPLKA